MKKLKNVLESSDVEILELHRFEFNEQHFVKIKFEHKRIDFLVFDDVIGSYNGALRKSGPVLQILLIRKSSSLYQFYINNTIY